MLGEYGVKPGVVVKSSGASGAMCAAVGGVVSATVADPFHHTQLPLLYGRPRVKFSVEPCASIVFGHEPGMKVVILALAFTFEVQARKACTVV